MPRFATSQARALASNHVVDRPFSASALCTRVERTGSADFLRRLFGWYPWQCILLILCLTSSACVATKPVADTSDSQRPEYVAAAQELRKLAEKGNVTAQHGLGLLYQAGRGVPRSYGQAKKWFEEAARQGHADAQVTLGTSYLRGDAAPQSSQMALFWFERAAEQGHVAAFANLGAMYAEANGVPQDMVQAYTWFLLAAENGDENSAQKRDLLAAKMNPAQIAQAQERARTWKPTSKSVAWKLFTSSQSVPADESPR
jgi:TPR repeat protein